MQFSRAEKFLLLASKELGIHRVEDWYRIKIRDILAIPGGGPFLENYGDSLQRALAELLPSVVWKPWLFDKVSKGFWKHAENRREYMEWLAVELGIDQKKKWSLLTVGKVKAFGGSGFLDHYGSSLRRALDEIYPDTSHEYILHARQHYYWKLKCNRQKLFELIANELGIEHYEQWYSVKVRDVLRKPGSAGCMAIYRNSLQRALRDLYPQFDWNGWRFQRVSVGFWNWTRNRRCYLNWLCTELGIVKSSDWNYLSQSQLQAFKASVVLKRFGGLNSFLSKCSIAMPFFRSPRCLNSLSNVLDSSNRGLCGASKAQIFLYRTFQQLFEDVEIAFNRKILLGKAGKRKEIDLYIPQYSLAVEYQGEQHYHQMDRFGLLKTQKYKDLLREEECEKAGLTLIVVPYWWNQRRSSVIALIHQRRPDLNPISSSERATVLFQTHPNVELSTTDIQPKFHTKKCVLNMCDGFLR